MEVKAKLNKLRMAPRKVRLAANLIKGMDVNKAKINLKFMLKKSAVPLLKLLDSAIANAKHNFNLNGENLYIKKILVNEGYKLKRYMPRAFGRAALIRKRTSNIEIILDEMVPGFGTEIKPKKIKNIEQEKEKAQSITEAIKKDKQLEVKRVLGKKGFDIKRKIFQRKAV